jgi:hypothetical protein
VIEGRIKYNRVKSAWGSTRVRTVQNRFNFIIFKNYDGTSTSRVMTREMYNKLFPETCSS